MSDLPGFLASRYDDLLELFVQHVQLVMIPIVVATVLAVGLALLVEANPIAREVVTTVSATSLTIPSLALFVLLIPLVGLGATAAYIGLTVYAVYPIFVNAVTGLGTVDRNVLESARGMGMSATQRVLRTKLPLAWPVILGGIRTTTTVLTPSRSPPPTSRPAGSASCSSRASADSAAPTPWPASSSASSAPSSWPWSSRPSSPSSNVSPSPGGSVPENTHHAHAARPPGP